MIESKEKTNESINQLIDYCFILMQAYQALGDPLESQKWFFLAKKAENQIIK